MEFKSRRKKNIVCFAGIFAIESKLILKLFIIGSPYLIRGPLKDVTSYLEINHTYLFISDSDVKNFYVEEQESKT